MTLISLLLLLIVILLGFWAVGRLLAAFKIEDPIAGVIYVLVVVLVILWLIGQIGTGRMPKMSRLQLAQPVCDTEGIA